MGEKTLAARVIGLDVGDVRVGVAVSDGLGITAQAVGQFRRKDVKSDVETVRRYIEQYDAGLIVVGLPLNMNGTVGPQTEKVLAFARQLESLGVEVVTFDERATTMMAERSLLEADVSRRKRREVRDQIAAALILQGYLDSRR